MYSVQFPRNNTNIGQRTGFQIVSCGTADPLRCRRRGGFDPSFPPGRPAYQENLRKPCAADASISSTLEVSLEPTLIPTFRQLLKATSTGRKDVLNSSAILEVAQLVSKMAQVAEAPDAASFDLRLARARIPHEELSEDSGGGSDGSAGRNCETRCASALAQKKR